MVFCMILIKKGLKSKQGSQNSLYLVLCFCWNEQNDRKEFTFERNYYR